MFCGGVMEYRHKRRPWWVEVFTANVPPYWRRCDGLVLVVRLDDYLLFEHGPEDPSPEDQWSFFARARPSRREDDVLPRRPRSPAVAIAVTAPGQWHSRLARSKPSGP
jgi:hypothetical protein